MFKMIFLLGLLKLLAMSGKPFLCSGLYAGFILVFKLLAGSTFDAVIIPTVIGFALSTVYFLLLNYFHESWLYWLILVVGLLIGLV